MHNQVKPTTIRMQKFNVGSLSWDEERVESNTILRFTGWTKEGGFRRAKECRMDQGPVVMKSYLNRTKEEIHKQGMSVEKHAKMNVQTHRLASYYAAQFAELLEKGA